MKKGYWVAAYRTVGDEATMKNYATPAGEALGQFGARPLVAFRIIWHTSELIIWRTSCESEVRMCGQGPFLPGT
jgi:uncharacterized protein (DUF1330 family)